MKWEMYRWVWILKSPVHLGISPAGMINRTRLYIPARTIWGSLTAEISRNEPNFREDIYDQIGQELQDKVRFTYLYPAQWEGNTWLAWLPDYSNGLKWQCERTSLSEREFRKKILFSIAATAIEPSSDTVEEGTLREMEIVQNYWRDNIEQSSPLAFVGYVFFTDSLIKDKVFKIKEIFVGADIRYGFGRLFLSSLDRDDSCFGKDVVLDRDEPHITTDIVFAHVKSEGTDLKGAMELLQFWDKNRFSIHGLAWCPGSRVKEKSLTFKIAQNGIWEPTSKPDQPDQTA